MPLPVLNGWAKRWRAWRDSPFRRATNEAAADADRTLWHVGSIVLLVLLVFKTVAQERLVGVWVLCRLPQACAHGARGTVCAGFGAARHA